MSEKPKKYVIGKDGRRYPVKPNYDHAEINRLTQAGYSTNAIAEFLGCSQSLVSYVQQKAKSKAQLA